MNDKKPQADIFKDRISQLSDVARLVEHFSFFNGHDWLFRGVTEVGHGLVPKIGRPEMRKRKKGGRLPYKEADERAVLAMFRQQARPYLSSPPSTPIEWIAIAQHYGLPTRLLDWTDSFLAAVWFAVEKAGAKEVDSAIWVTRGVPPVDENYSGDPLTIKNPKIYRPPHISPRIIAQGSVLMVCPKPTKEVSLPVIKKITIDRLAEPTLKKRLTACGINKSRLFPDLIGLSDHLGWMYKNNWLAGYREEGSDKKTISPDMDD